jgi:hypothetical protein
VAQFTWTGAYQDCWPVETPAFLPLYFGPPIVYESMLCVLAGWKCWERVRETRTNPLASRALYDVLVRDSIAYYVVILATYAINVWSWVAYLVRPRVTSTSRTLTRALAAARQSRPRHAVRDRDPVAAWWPTVAERARRVL